MQTALHPGETESFLLFEAVGENLIKVCLPWVPTSLASWLHTQL